MFGTLQVAFKHRRAIFSRSAPGVGFAALPNILVFQFLFTLIAPVVDVMLVWTLLGGLLAFLADPAAGVPVGIAAVVGYWLMFQTVEFVAAAIAIEIGGDRSAWRLMPLILVQRFCYRQLLYWTAIRTALAALKGNFVGWGKLQRTGSVAMSPVATPETAASPTVGISPLPSAGVDRIVSRPILLPAPATSSVSDHVIAA
jgi:hypothetical protein